MIDIGVNLNSGQFNGDRDAMIQRARDAGVTQHVCIASDLNESRDCLGWAQRYDLYCTAGVHPHQAKTWHANSADELVAFLAHEKVIAIGECGLDFNRNFSTPSEQENAFREQMLIAVQHRKPLYLHCRDAHARFIEMLDAVHAQQTPAVLHCFTGTKKELLACCERDLYIGITGWICDERRGAELLELLPDIPRDRLLLETDAPYLIPRDLPLTFAPKSTRRNESAFLPHIAQRVADKWHCDLAQLIEQTTLNARRLFGLP